GARPVLVFEFQPGEAAPGSSKFGTSYELARLISQGFEGGMTVAYVPQPLKGYAVLAALACDDVVMGGDAALGPITPEGETPERAFRGPVQELAVRKGRDPALLLGMLNPEADLRAVRTADQQLAYVTADKLAEFMAAHPGSKDQPAWDAGRRGV